MSWQQDFWYTGQNPITYLHLPNSSSITSSHELLPSKSVLVFLADCHVVSKGSADWRLNWQQFMTESYASGFNGWILFNIFLNTWALTESVSWKSYYKRGLLLVWEGSGKRLFRKGASIGTVMAERIAKRVDYFFIWHFLCRFMQIDQLSDQLNACEIKSK